jgi:hypothetical protein
MIDKNVAASIANGIRNQIVIITGQTSCGSLSSDLGILDIKRQGDGISIFSRDISHTTIR